MTDFKRGDRVLALDPDTDAEIEGSSETVAELNDALETPREGGTSTTAAAWIRLDDHTFRRGVLHRIRPAYWQSRAQR
jgi:hypothetical protein